MKISDIEKLTNEQLIEIIKKYKICELKPMSRNQAMEQFLGLEKVNPWRLRPRTADMAPPHLAFEVKFQKEHVVGEGGPYREFFDEICRELQSPDGLLSLLVPCPNQLLSFGENREKFIPGARRTDYLSLKKY